MTITRIEDGPENAAGLMVAFTDGEDGLRGVLVQAGATRYILDPADARDMAEALGLVATIVETGSPPGSVLLPMDAPIEQLSDATERNRRLLRA